MMDAPEEDAATIQAIQKWCALHRTEKHSNADCRAQKEAANNASPSKKRPKGKDKRKQKTQRLKFKSTADKKKFMRSIEDAEGVSIETSSDDEDVVAQSLMQLENDASQTSDDEEEGDLHILMISPDLLSDPDVAMDSILGSNQNNATKTVAPSANVSVRLEGEKVDFSMLSTNPEVSPSDLAFETTSPLASPSTTMNTPIVSVPTYKEEENPFSPDLASIPLDEEMFPSLETPMAPQPYPTSPSIAHNYILVGGVYYQAVPPPHNVVVAQSMIPTPVLVPVQDASASHPAIASTADSAGAPVPDVEPPNVPEKEEAEGNNDHEDANSGLGSVSQPIAARAAEPDFVLKTEEGQEGQNTQEETPTEDSAPNPKQSQMGSRASSPCHSEKTVTSSRTPRGVTPIDVIASAQKIRGVGRGKPKDQGPLVAPSTPLNSISAPRENFRITITAWSDKRLVERIPNSFLQIYPDNVSHLAKLETEVRQHWDSQLPATVQPDFCVELPQRDLHKEDSDVDLRSGEITDATSKTEPVQFTFSSLSVLEEHQQFAQEILRLEPESWDLKRVESNPCLFYHAYFLDQQKLNEVRQKGTVRIQQFNVKVNRQSPDRDFSTSSRVNREKLESRFKTALTQKYQAFEEAFQFESPEFITELRNHLVKTAVTHITSLFASSRCRTCHRGCRMDAVWRLRRFETLLPYLCEVPAESYRRAEDYRANVLLDKTALVADGTPADKYQLGHTADDRRLYFSLTAAERKSFDEELAALANVNSLMRMSRRWENCKDVSPALDINLGHQSFQRIRHLRRMNLLSVAQMLLHRYHDRQLSLIDRFGKMSVQK